MLDFACYIRVCMALIVAIQLPPYFQQPSRMTRHNHPLALRQIRTSVNFYKYSFFPLIVVQQVTSRCYYAAYTSSIRCGSQAS